MGQAIDYYFFYGPDLNRVIADYRQLTGEAPLFPKWAYGYWQCRERYHSQQEILDTAAEFRKRKIPVDALVQDWQYWGKYGWNAMKFDEDHYPQPKEMMDQLHAKDVHMLISIWSRFGEETDVYKRMKAQVSADSGRTLDGLLQSRSSNYVLVGTQQRHLRRRHGWLVDGRVRAGVRRAQGQADVSWVAESPSATHIRSMSRRPSTKVNAQPRTGSES